MSPGRLFRAVGTFIIMILVAGTLGCASARMSDQETDSLFRSGKYEEAADRLQKGLGELGESHRDELLYLLDIGLSLHSAGKYEESNQAFFKADKIAEIKDYTSLATESATLLTSDNIKDYKGEDFEKVLINTYLAMNFALMGKWESAQVEARRVNRKLEMMITDGQRKYKQNAFARYLSALLYEAEGNFNEAYIDYKKVYELEPTYPGLGRDLWRTAWLSRMGDEMERWDQKLGLSKQDHDEAKKFAPRSGNGEIIVLYQNGISPRKKPHPDFYSIPKFYARPNPVSSANIEIARVLAGPGREPAQQPAPEWKPIGTTAKLHDIEQTAIENLDEKYAGIVARKVAGVVAKEVIGHQVGKATESPLLGAITKLALYASDQADLRSWNLLPRDLQVLRIPVEPGTYQVRALPGGGAPTADRTIQVEKGKKVFVTFRYMP